MCKRYNFIYFVVSTFFFLKLRRYGTLFYENIKSVSKILIGVYSQVILFFVGHVLFMVETKIAIFQVLFPAQLLLTNMLHKLLVRTEQKLWYSHKSSFTINC